MKKKILSGILAFTMCFSMISAITWGGEMTEFSSGEEVNEKIDDKQEFTDAYQRNLSMQEEVVPETEIWSDGQETLSVGETGDAKKNNAKRVLISTYYR